MVHKRKAKWTKHNMEAFIIGSIPSSVQSTDIEYVLGGMKKGFKFHGKADEYGERAWRVKGKWGTVVYWDQGNGWSQPLKIEKLDTAFFTKIKGRIDRLNKTNGWEQ